MVWLATFAVFRCAPVQQLHDSKYTMLLAENLIRHHDLDLARYDLPSDDYRLRTFGEHRYYFFPPGSAVLSVPFVEIMRWRGLSTVRPDGSYNERGELAMDARLAAALMATFAALIYATTRLLLPTNYSVVVAGIVAFGTQVLSTASRSMWSDTWGILLVGGAIFVLLRASVRGVRNSPVLLAALLTLAYIVRPTNAVALIAVAIPLWRSGRRVFAKFVAVVTAIGCLFAVHSWTQFHAILPPYFAANRLTFPTPLEAVVGNLVSPSRGLLVFVPSVLVVIVALARYRRAVRHRALLGAAAFVIVAHFAILAGYWDWWGGHSYGPRLTTSLVPWFALLAVLAVDGARANGAERGHARGDLAFLMAGGFLCAVSILMNAVGACSWDADRWNVNPDNINADTGRLWDWRRPQFLAPTSAIRAGVSGSEKHSSNFLLPAREP
jgi:hypothetical protein